MNSQRFRLDPCSASLTWWSLIIASQLITPFFRFFLGWFFVCGLLLRWCQGQGKKSLLFLCQQKTSHYYIDNKQFTHLQKTTPHTHRMLWRCVPDRGAPNVFRLDNAPLRQSFPCTMTNVSLLWAAYGRGGGQSFITSTRSNNGLHFVSLSLKWKKRLYYISLPMNRSLVRLRSCTVSELL